MERGASSLPAPAKISKNSKDVASNTTRAIRESFYANVGRWAMGRLTHSHTDTRTGTWRRTHTGTHTHTHTHTRAHARSGLIDETHRACWCVCVRHGNAVKERSTCVDGSDTTGRRCEATANGGGPAASRDRRQGVAWSRRARDLILQ